MELHPPIPIRFSEETVKEIKEIQEELKIVSFQETVRQIVNRGITAHKRYGG